MVRYWPRDTPHLERHDQQAWGKFIDRVGCTHCGAPRGHVCMSMGIRTMVASRIHAARVRLYNNATSTIVQRLDDAIHIEQYDLSNLRDGAKWFGVSEWWQDSLSNSSFAMVAHGGHVNPDAALNWVTRQQESRMHRPATYGFIIKAYNITQVREWLLRHGYTVRGSYNLMYPDTLTEREEPMSNRRNARIASMEAAKARADAEILRLMSLPEEPTFKDDRPKVVFFQKKFSGTRRIYDYAVIKAGDGLWYTTGPRTPKGYTWDELVDWMYEDGSEIYMLTIATRFKDL